MLTLGQNAKFIIFVIINRTIFNLIFDHLFMKKNEEN
jgi:hypothetical protein